MEAGEDGDYQYPDIDEADVSDLTKTRNRKAGKGKASDPMQGTKANTANTATQSTIEHQASDGRHKSTQNTEGGSKTDVWSNPDLQPVDGGPPPMSRALAHSVATNNTVIVTWANNALWDFVQVSGTGWALQPDKPHPPGRPAQPAQHSQHMLTHLPFYAPAIYVTSHFMHQPF